MGGVVLIRVYSCMWCWEVKPNRKPWITVNMTWKPAYPPSSLDPIAFYLPCHKLFLLFHTPLLFCPALKVDDCGLGRGGQTTSEWGTFWYLFVMSSLTNIFFKVALPNFQIFGDVLDIWSFIVSAIPFGFKNVLQMVLTLWNVLKFILLSGMWSNNGKCSIYVKKRLLRYCWVEGSLSVNQVKSVFSIVKLFLHLLCQLLRDKK